MATACRHREKPMTESDEVNILGVPVQVHTMETLLARIEEAIAEPGCKVAYAVNAHTANHTYRHKLYREMLQGAEIVYADGQSILLAARFLGGDLPIKLTTTDVWPPACELAQRKGYTFFLLGGEEGPRATCRGRHPGKVPGPEIRRCPPRLLRRGGRERDRGDQRRST